MVNYFTFLQKRLTGWLALFLMTLLLSGPQEAAAQCGYAEGLGCSNTDYNNFGFGSNNSAATIEYDNYSGAFHGSVVREYNGNFRIWGQSSNASGEDHLSPVVINKANYPGLANDEFVLKATLGSNQQNSEQTFVLTNLNRIWYWGNGTNTPVVTNDNNSSPYSGTNMRSMDLPTNVTAAMVKVFYAVPRSIAIVTCDGLVYVRSQQADMRGVGGNGSVNGWNKVQKTGGVDLTNVIALRGTDQGFFALSQDGSGNQSLWTWGPRTYDGSSAADDRNLATTVSNPAGANNIKMIAVSGRTSSGNAITYFVLGKDGKLYSMGDGANNILGNWGTSNSTSWVRPKYPNAGGTAAGADMNDIQWVSGSDHDNGYNFVNVINSNKQLYNWGEQSGFCLGRSNINPPTNGSGGAGVTSRVGYNPGIPLFGYTSGNNTYGSLTPLNVLAVESGGHTTMISAECKTNFGYVGHFTNGSMGQSNAPAGSIKVGTGDGSTSGNTYDAVPYFTFETVGLQPCGAFSVPLIDVAGTINSDDDGSYCKEQPINLVGLPAGGSFSITVGGDFATLNGNQLNITGTPASWPATVTVRYTVPGLCDVDYVEKSFVFDVCQDLLSVSGKVWIDDNANLEINPGEDGTNLGVLWANLVDATGKVVGKAPVNADGTYTLNTSTAGTYSVVITKTEIGLNQTISNDAKLLPEGWQYTGNTGTPGSGTPCEVADGCTTPGTISNIVLGGTGSSSYSDLDFGIKKKNTTEAVNDENSTWINTPVSGNVTTNDFDPQGDNQTFQSFLNQDGSGTAITSGATVSGVDANGNTVTNAGTLTWGSDGSYTFTPATGFTGTVSIPYQTCDNGTPQACAIAYLDITVSPLPDNSNSIIANNDEYISYGSQVAGDVTHNDLDPQGDNYTVTGFTFDSNGDGSPNQTGTVGTPTQVGGVRSDGTATANAGEFTLNMDGTFTFNPTPGFTGEVTIDYVICDNNTPQACDPATITITVLGDQNGPANDPPFAGDDFSYTQANTPVDGNFIGNDYDPNGNPITMKDGDGNPVTITPGTSNPVAINTVTTEHGGTVIFYSDGTYTYNPPLDYVGPDNVTYEICDNSAPVMPTPLCTQATIHMLSGPGYSLSGNVYNDGNGLTDGTVNGDGTNAGGLFATLTDDEGNVIKSVPVNPDGTYNFDKVPGNIPLQVVLTTTQKTPGAKVTASDLPEGWVSTGEHNGSGAGDDGTVNGISAVIPALSSTGNVNNVNFGIDRVPVADNKLYEVGSGVFTNAEPQEGFPVVSGYQGIPMASGDLKLSGNPSVNGSLSSSDAEDCVAAGSCNGNTGGTGATFTIETINANTKLYYDFGPGNGGVMEITPGMSIPNFDVTKMVIYGELGSGTTGDEIGFTYTMTDAAGVKSSPATYQIRTNAPLPINLLSFEAAKRGNVSDLHWTTSSETNNKGFEVLRSADGRNWKTIGFVNSLSTNGTSVNRLDYNFTDNTPVKGNNYYRLKQTDLNGQFNYSKIKMVNFTDGGKIEIYPNPFSNKINIAGLNGREIIVVYDFTGREVSRFVAGQSNVELALDRLNTGAYNLVIISDDGSWSVNRVIKVD